MARLSLAYGSDSSDEHSGTVDLKSSGGSKAGKATGSLEKPPKTPVRRSARVKANSTSAVTRANAPTETAPSIEVIDLITPKTNKKKKSSKQARSTRSSSRAKNVSHKAKVNGDTPSQSPIDTPKKSRPATGTAPKSIVDAKLALTPVVKAKGRTVQVEGKNNTPLIKTLGVVDTNAVTPKLNAIAQWTPGPSKTPLFRGMEERDETRVDSDEESKVSADSSDTKRVTFDSCVDANQGSTKAHWTTQFLGTSSISPGLKKLIREHSPIEYIDDADPNVSDVSRPSTDCKSAGLLLDSGIDSDDEDETLLSHDGCTVIHQRSTFGDNTIATAPTATKEGFVGGEEEDATRANNPDELIKQPTITPQNLLPALKLSDKYRAPMHMLMNKTEHLTIQDHGDVQKDAIASNKCDGLAKQPSADPEKPSPGGKWSKEHLPVEELADAQEGTHAAKKCDEFDKQPSAAPKKPSPDGKWSEEHFEGAAAASNYDVLAKPPSVAPKKPSSHGKKVNADYLPVEDIADVQEGAATASTNRDEPAKKPSVAAEKLSSDGKLSGENFRVQDLASVKPGAAAANNHDKSSEQPSAAPFWDWILPPPTPVPQRRLPVEDMAGVQEGAAAATNRNDPAKQPSAAPEKPSPDGKLNEEHLPVKDLSDSQEDTAAADNYGELAKKPSEAPTKPCPVGKSSDDYLPDEDLAGAQEGTTAAKKCGESTKQPSVAPEKSSLGGKLCEDHLPVEDIAGVQEGVATASTNRDEPAKKPSVAAEKLSSDGKLSGEKFRVQDLASVKQGAAAANNHGKSYEQPSAAPELTSPDGKLSEEYLPVEDMAGVQEGAAAATNRNDPAKQPSVALEKPSPDGKLNEEHLPVKDLSNAQEDAAAADNYGELAKKPSEAPKKPCPVGKSSDDYLPDEDLAGAQEGATAAKKCGESTKQPSVAPEKSSLGGKLCEDHLLVEDQACVQGAAKDTNRDEPAKHPSAAPGKASVVGKFSEEHLSVENLTNVQEGAATATNRDEPAKSLSSATKEPLLGGKLSEDHLPVKSLANVQEGAVAAINPDQPSKRPSAAPEKPSTDGKLNGNAMSGEAIKDVALNGYRNDSKLPTAIVESALPDLTRLSSDLAAMKMSSLAGEEEASKNPRISTSSSEKSGGFMTLAEKREMPAVRGISYLDEDCGDKQKGAFAGDNCGLASSTENSDADAKVKNLPYDEAAAENSKVLCPPNENDQAIGDASVGSIDEAANLMMRRHMLPKLSFLGPGMNLGSGMNAVRYAQETPLSDAQRIRAMRIQRIRTMRSLDARRGGHHDVPPH